MGRQQTFTACGMFLIRSNGEMVERLESGRLSRAAASRLALVAVDVLDDACKAADFGPVERTVLHQLALGYLMLAGVTRAHQVRKIWAILGHEGTFDQLSCRQSYGGVMLDGMRMRAKAIADPTNRSI